MLQIGVFVWVALALFIGFCINPWGALVFIIYWAWLIYKALK